MTPRPGVLETLKKLRAAKDPITGAPRYKLGILSNGHQECLERAGKFGFWPDFEFDDFFGPTQARRFFDFMFLNFVFQQLNDSIFLFFWKIDSNHMLLFIELCSKSIQK